MSLLAAYPKQTPSRTFASVYSGEKAVEKGKKEYDAGREYSTIILDWKMPGMNAHIAKPINPDTLKTP